MQAPPVDPAGESCENVGLNPKPNPHQTTAPTDVVNAQYRSASVTSCLSTMTPCSPPAGCRDSGYVTDGSPANVLSIPFSFEQGSSEQPYQHLSLPSSPSMPSQLRYRYHHHHHHHYHHRQQQSHQHYHHHQMGSVTHGAVGGHGPDAPAPSSVSSMDDHVIYESDSQDEVDGSDDDDSDSDDDDDDSEEEEDDVFASDSASGSFRDDHIPNYPIRGASQPIPIRNPGGRVNRYNNNNYNNNNNNNNYNLSNESLIALDVAHPCSSYPLDDRPRHWQQLYHLRTSGSEMSPEVDHVGNVYIPCSWAPELRRTIGTQTHPTCHTNPIFNFAACRLHQQRLAATSGTNQRRLRFSEGEDPMATNRQEPLPDIVPIPRNRAQSLPEVPIRRTNIRAFGQELRRISDEYYQSHNTRSRSESNGQAFSFPGANRINRVLDRILSLGRPLNDEDDPSDHPPPPPP